MEFIGVLIAIIVIALIRGRQRQGYLEMQLPFCGKHLMDKLSDTTKGGTNVLVCPRCQPREAQRILAKRQQWQQRQRAHPQPAPPGQGGELMYVCIGDGQ